MLAYSKEILISLYNLYLYPIYYKIMEDIYLIKPYKRLPFANKYAFISNILLVIKAIESKAKSIAAKVFTYIFFNKLFI